MIQRRSLKITTSDRDSLLKEFNQLETIKQKYDFWHEKFNERYAFWYMIHYEEVQDFMIPARNREEIEELNRLIFSDCQYYINIRKKQEGPDGWKEKFIETAATALDIETFKLYELDKIKESVSKIKQRIYKDDSAFTHMIDGENKHFKEGFEEYLIHRKEIIDWGKHIYYPGQLSEWSIGTDWAKYYEFIANYKLEEKKQPELKLTGEQKFLILHYMGFGSDLKTNTQKSILYEYFIDELKQKSIARLYNNIKDHETEKNLNALVEFFRLIKFSSKTRELEDKLDNLKKKRQRK